MNQTQFGRWTIELDATATREAYSNVESGSPEACDCTPCLNFAAQSHNTFPAALLSFLTAAGVPVDREAEIHHHGRLDSGLHSYGVWFHFAGNLVIGAALRGSLMPQPANIQCEAANGEDTTDGEC